MSQTHTSQAGTSQPRICPNCRTAVPADAPEGVCPACALRAGFDLSEGTGAPTWTSPARRAPPLAPEELARRLPELDQFELLGQGGMGAVYRARHRNLGRPVAVKVLDSALRDNADFSARFAREARTLAQLDHPNVVRVHDFGHRDDLYYLVMELVDGVNLRQVIRAGNLEPKQALVLVPQICEALQYAHDHGVVHRDVKPENILVDREGTVKIADFGLAKLVGAEAGGPLTRAEQVMGTPNYMAPEQIENPSQVDHRADIYALGVVFYELLTGELPLGRFPPPSRCVQVDVRIDEVVLRTLDKEPALRYQQASELRSDVESLSNAGLSYKRSGGPRRPYEYRSARTVFGWPLVHIAFSRDDEGKSMRWARGVIAIGDGAVGAVAFGGLAFGGLAFGGLSVGLMSFGGIALGMLTALGGLGIGLFATAGIAIGTFTNSGTSVNFLLWLIMSVAVTVGVSAAGYAWALAAQARRQRHRTAVDEGV